MKKITSYDPKNYKSRNYVIGFLNILTKNNIYHHTNRFGIRYNIEVRENDFEEASKLLKAYTEQKEKEHQQFVNGIKFNFSKTAYNVNSLYNKLQRHFPAQVYLPDGWKGGKSIQNYKQSDFYTFSFINIKGSKTLNGNYIYVSMLTKKKVWILPLKFQSQIDGTMEDMQLARIPLSFEGLLDELSVKTFTGDEIQSMLDNKVLFFTNK